MEAFWALLNKFYYTYSSQLSELAGQIFTEVIQKRLTAILHPISTGEKNYFEDKNWVDGIMLLA